MVANHLRFSQKKKIFNPISTMCIHFFSKAHYEVQTKKNLATQIPTTMWPGVWKNKWKYDKCLLCSKLFWSLLLCINYQYKVWAHLDFQKYINQVTIRIFQENKPIQQIVILIDTNHSFNIFALLRLTRLTRLTR